MRLVFGLVLIVGLGLAGFAVYMAQNYIGAYEAALVEARSKESGEVPVAEIYVAVKPIGYGEVITEEHIRLAPWPLEIMPEEHFSADQPVLVPGEARRVALRPIEKFEAILPIKVSEPGGEAGLTTLLNPGESAFAIEVDVASGVSGHLRPGHNVDVYWTGSVGRISPDSNGGEVTKLIQSGLRLIAVDQNSNAESATTTVARTVTVAASPQQVGELTHAQRTGKLTLSLIAQGAVRSAEAIEVDQLSMLGIERAAVPVPEAQAEVCTTRERRGTEVIISRIPCTN